MVGFSARPLPEVQLQIDGRNLRCFFIKATSSVTDINVRLSGKQLKLVGDRDQIVPGHRPLLMTWIRSCAALVTVDERVPIGICWD